MTELIKNGLNNRVSVGDIMKGVDSLMMGEKAELFYCDPPWGEGMLKAFETMRLKNSNLSDEHRRQLSTIEDFYDQMFKLANKHTTGYVVVENGFKWIELQNKIAEKNGLEPLAIIGSKYGPKNNKHKIVLYGRGEKEPTVIQGFKKMDGVNGVKLIEGVLKATGAKSVLDPCCGLGMTAEAAAKQDVFFYGNELCPVRAHRAIDRIAKYD